METLTQIINILFFLGLGMLTYTALFFGLRSVLHLPSGFYGLGALFMGVVMLDNISAVGWAIVNHNEHIFHYNWWSTSQWFPFHEIPNTVPAGNPDGLSALKVLFEAFWQQSVAAMMTMFLWWSLEAAAFAYLARKMYLWLSPRLA